MSRKYHLDATPADEKVRMMILQLSNPTQRIRKFKTRDIGFEPKLFQDRIRLHNPSWQILQTLSSLLDRERFRIVTRNAFSRSQTKDSVSTRSAFHSRRTLRIDRKSTRLNSSHSQISYAVFCLKK